MPVQHTAATSSLASPSSTPLREALLGVLATAEGTREAEQAWRQALLLVLPPLADRCDALIADQRTRVTTREALAIDALLAALPTLETCLGAMRSDAGVLAYLAVTARRVLVRELHRGGDALRARAVDVARLPADAAVPFWPSVPPTPRDLAIRAAVESVLAAFPASEAAALRAYLEEGTSLRQTMRLLSTRRIGSAHAARQRGLEALRTALAPLVRLAPAPRPWITVHGPVSRPAARRAR